MTQLQDRTIIVTGGASGIGAAAATLFARYGATVVVADLNDDAGRGVAARIAQDGGRAAFVRCDIAREEDVAALVDETVRLFGRLDGAFNNAGIEQSIKLLHDISPAEWQRHVGIDLSGVFYCLKYEIAAMLKTGGGSIVNTASSMGQKAISRASEYIAAKHGVLGLTRAAAVDYGASGIRVNAVLPGMTDTAMARRGPTDPELVQIFTHVQQTVPMKRMARPEEIAEAAAWLLSDAASFVTGAALPIDGGFLAA